MTPERAVAPAVVGGAQRIARRWLGNTLLWVVIGLAIIATILSGGIFLNPSNLVTILFQVSVVAVLAIGETVVILTGGIDLSVGAVVVFSAIVISATSKAQSVAFPQTGPIPALVIGLLIGAAVGFANGNIVSRTRIPPFIATLAMYLLVGGMSNMVTRGIGVYSDPFFQGIGRLRVGLVPAPVIGWILLIVLFHLFLTRTSLGFKLYAIGGNERASIIAGLDVRRTKIYAYTLCGLLSGVGAVFFLARTGYAIPSAGSDYLLTSISAVVIAGVSLSGGEGRLSNVFLGIITLAILGNVMNLMLISPFVQGAVQGALIILAVGINRRLGRAQPN
jgi:ribose/xylose/arabinose/galactoside ABC-type transport system permease subunit